MQKEEAANQEARGKVLGILSTTVHRRLTPEFLVAVSKPGNVDWFELLLNTAFDRIEGKSNKPKTHIVG